MFFSTSSHFQWFFLEDARKREMTTCIPTLLKNKKFLGSFFFSFLYINLITTDLTFKSVSYHFSNTSISFLPLEVKNPHQIIFFIPCYFPSYHFTKIFPMSSMSTQESSLLSSSSSAVFVPLCHYTQTKKKKKKKKSYESLSFSQSIYIFIKYKDYIFGIEFL